MAHSFYKKANKNRRQLKRFEKRMSQLNSLCVKAEYHTEERAALAGALTMQRHYRCPKCEVWHLTSDLR